MKLDLALSDLGYILSEQDPVRAYETRLNSIYQEIQSLMLPDVLDNIVLIDPTQNQLQQEIRIIDEDSQDDVDIQILREDENEEDDSRGETLIVDFTEDTLILDDDQTTRITFDVDALDFSPGRAAQRINEIKGLIQADLDQMQSLITRHKQLLDAGQASQDALYQQQRARLQDYDNASQQEIQANQKNQVEFNQNLDQINAAIKNHKNELHRWWILPDLLPVLFLKRLRAIDQLNARIASINEQIRQANTGHTSLMAWYVTQKDELDQETRSEIASLEKRFRSQARDSFHNIDDTYQNCRSLILEFQQLLDRWFDYWADQLRSWHPELDSSFWQKLRQGALEGRATLQNPGLRVGTLALDDRARILPAVLDPIGHSKHVFIQGGTSGSRASLMHALLLRLTLAFPIGLARLLLIDSAEQGRTLNLYSTKLHEDLSGGKVFDREQAIAEEINKIRDRISQINQHVLVEFPSIDAYNQANPDIPTPYQFIVTNNFPKGFNNQALTALQDIMRNGPRAGIYFIATVSDTIPDQHNFDLNTYLGENYQLTLNEGELIQWNSEYLNRYQVKVDESSDEVNEVEILKVISKVYADKPIVVEYERIRRALPVLWSVSTTTGLRAPVGMTFGGKLHEIEFTDQYAHGLVGGRTGSGKTVLLHDLICGLGQNHGPDELELYLLDFKGTEFDVYAKNSLPHARVVAVDCDTEVGLDVIRRLGEEMDHRRKLFTDADVPDIQSYREKGHALPRILLIVDEIQMLTQQSTDMNQIRLVENGIIDLLRRGRAMGIHVLLGTQSPSNVLTNQMLQQLAVRICLLADQQVSRLVLGEANEAASGLQKPGEAVYNAYNGDSHHNIFIRAALLKKDQIAQITRNIRDEANQREYHPSKELYYFDGSTRSTLLDNTLTKKCLQIKKPTELPATLQIPLGNAVGPKEDLSIRFARERYSNLVMLGGDPKELHELFRSILLGIYIQQTAAMADFYLVDLTFADLPFVNVLRSFQSMPHGFQFAPNSQLGCDLIAEIHQRLQERKETARGGGKDDKSIFLAIFGAENFSDLRGADKFTKTETRKRLDEILKDGPSVGIHVVVATQTLAKGEILGADDFGARICFQISEDDSRALLDSDAGTKLRPDRAIFRRREWPHGRVDKFKPYLEITAEQISETGDRLTEREGRLE